MGDHLVVEAVQPTLGLADPVRRVVDDRKRERRAFRRGISTRLADGKRVDQVVDRAAKCMDTLAEDQAPSLGIGGHGVVDEHSVFVRRRPRLDPERVRVLGEPGRHFLLHRGEMEACPVDLAPYGVEPTGVGDLVHRSSVGTNEGGATSNSPTGNTRRTSCCSTASHARRSVPGDVPAIAQAAQMPSLVPVRTAYWSTGRAPDTTHKTASASVVGVPRSREELDLGVLDAESVGIHRSARHLGKTLECVVRDHAFNDSQSGEEDHARSSTDALAAFEDGGRRCTQCRSLVCRLSGPVVVRDLRSMDCEVPGDRRIGASDVVHHRVRLRGVEGL